MRTASDSTGATTTTRSSSGRDAGMTPAERARIVREAFDNIRRGLKFTRASIERRKQGKAAMNHGGD